MVWCFPVHPPPARSYFSLGLRSGSMSKPEADNRARDEPAGDTTSYSDHQDDAGGH